MDVSSFFASRGVLVARDALDYISSQPDPIGYAKKILERNGEKKFLKLDDVKIDEDKTESLVKEEEKVQSFLSSDFRPIARDIDARIKVFDAYDITGKSEGSGQIGDFIELFRDRFKQISKLLRMRGSVVKDITSLKKRRYDQDVRVIGMVAEKRVSRKGHILIILEDLDDQLTVMVSKNDKKLMTKAMGILPDEVIAVEGRLWGANERKDPLFIAKDIIQPDVPPRKPKTSDEDVAVAMISDTHVGSKLFLNKVFDKFLDWLNGKGPRKELAGKVKYLTIAGDLVDGVGVYPGQEDELEILDIYEQYSAFERLIEEVPDYITIVIIPGNHDAVRLADPQPAIPKELLPNLYKLDNVYLLGSPAYVSLHGIEFLLYHGHSIHSYAPYIQGFDYSQPERFGIEALKRRHLHVIYGEKPPLAPEKKDYLVIRQVPDVMHFGDVHKNGYTNYRGVTIINSGTWQDITPYQIKQGHHPTPGILPVISLRDRRLNILKFKKGDLGA